MNTEIGELFQQIHSLKNELEIASRNSAKLADEIEKDNEEIKQLIEKKEYLLHKIEAKISKKLQLEELLRSDKLKVDFFRQVVEKLKIANDTLKHLSESCRSKLEQERANLEKEICVDHESDSILNSTLKMKEELKEIKVKIEIIKLNIEAQETKKKKYEEVQQRVIELENKCGEAASIAIDIENQTELLEKEEEELRIRKELLLSNLQETNATWINITSELEREKDNQSYLSDFNASLRAHYDIVKKQPAIPRRRTPNFQYNVHNKN